MSKARELAELGAVYDSGALSNRNLIINGDFSISQRGDYSSATAISTATYYLDRWKTDISGVSATIEHDAVDLPNGITTKSAKIAASSSASGYMQLTQPIETQSFMDNRKVTISAYVRSNNANTRIRVEGAVSGNFDGTAHTGGGGWELLKETITVVNSVSAFRAGVIMWNSGAISISSGDFLEIAHFQAEFGTEATPFEQRSIGDELRRCQRYYEVLNQNSRNSAGGDGFNNVATGASNGSNVYGNLSFKVTKRGRPAVAAEGSAKFRTFGDGTYANLVAGEFYSPAVETVRIRVDTNGFSAGQAGAIEFDGANSTNGFISIDAEL